MWRITPWEQWWRRNQCWLFAYRFDFADGGARTASRGSPVVVARQRDCCGSQTHGSAHGSPIPAGSWWGRQQTRFDRVRKSHRRGLGRGHSARQRIGPPVHRQKNAYRKFSFTHQPHFHSAKNSTAHISLWELFKDSITLMSWKFGFQVDNLNPAYSLSLIWDKKETVIERR